MLRFGSAAPGRRPGMTYRVLYPNLPALHSFPAHIPSLLSCNNVISRFPHHTLPTGVCVPTTRAPERPDQRVPIDFCAPRRVQDASKMLFWLHHIFDAIWDRFWVLFGSGFPPSLVPKTDQNRSKIGAKRRFIFFAATLKPASAGRGRIMQTRQGTTRARACAREDVGIYPESAARNTGGP